MTLEEYQKIQRMINCPDDARSLLLEVNHFKGIIKILIEELQKHCHKDCKYCAVPMLNLECMKKEDNL